MMGLRLGLNRNNGAERKYLAFYFTGTALPKAPSGIFRIQAVLNKKVTIDWGDGERTTIIGNANEYQSITHNYLSSNTYKIKIIGYKNLKYFSIYSNQFTGDLSGWDISGLTSLRLFYISSNQFTGGPILTENAAWNGGSHKINANSGITVLNISAILMGINTYDGEAGLLDAAGCASMADTKQGGIWGDYSGSPTPSELAEALKSLVKSKSWVITLQGVAQPGETGDGTGFPAGFGDWWRL